MNIRKKWFCLFLAVVMLVISTPVKADDILGDISTGEMGAGFAHDRILVVLTHEASLNFKSYTANDFSEIACAKVTNLTAAIGNKVQQKLRQTETAAQAAAFEETASSFMKNLDVDAYQQVLSVELSNPGLASVFSAINLLSRRDDVYAAEPDFYMYEQSVASVPNDPYYSDQQAYMNLINMPEAWDLATSNNMVTVGVIDTGIYAAHEDLEDKVLTSLCREFYPSDYGTGGCTDAIGHGTMVAGVLAATGNNGDGISGVAAKSNFRLVSLYVGDRNRGMYASSVISAISYASILEIPILNMSVGYWWDDEEEGEAAPITYDNPEGLKSAIRDYPGLFVCSAGNEGESTDRGTYHNYPSEYDLSNIIAVGACTSSGMRASFSNYGATTVDIFAPGVGIYTCTSGGGYASDNGTSYAAPFVSGVAALIWAEDVLLTPAQVKARILNNAHTTSALSGYCVTGGYLDAAAALEG